MTEDNEIYYFVKDFDDNLKEQILKIINNEIKVNHNEMIAIEKERIDEINIIIERCKKETYELAIKEFIEENKS